MPSGSIHTCAARVYTHGCRVLAHLPKARGPKLDNQIACQDLAVRRDSAAPARLSQRLCSSAGRSPRLDPIRSRRALGRLDHDSVPRSTGATVFPGKLFADSLISALETVVPLLACCKKKLEIRDRLLCSRPAGGRMRVNQGASSLGAMTVSLPGAIFGKVCLGRGAVRAGGAQVGQRVGRSRAGCFHFLPLPSVLSLQGMQR